MTYMENVAHRSCLYIKRCKLSNVRLLELLGETATEELFANKNVSEAEFMKLLENMLSCRDENFIHEFENVCMLQAKNESTNSLANWSDLIIKDKPQSNDVVIRGAFGSDSKQIDTVFSGNDYYVYVAAKVFKKAEKNVTKNERLAVKMSGITSIANIKAYEGYIRDLRQRIQFEKHNKSSK